MDDEEMDSTSHHLVRTGVKFRRLAVSRVGNSVGCCI